MWYHLRLLEHCNLACNHCCASKREKSPKMDKKVIAHIADQIQEIHSKRKDPAIIYLSGGEPLLNLEFDAILTNLSELAFIDRIHVLTNGQLVKKNGSICSE